ncbi:MAG: hypothetical protein JXB50_00825 [Spirochaetes bacterium]|nr:hypothetical protein [Spirochaetota bacterium]
MSNINNNINNKIIEFHSALTYPFNAKNILTIFTEIALENTFSNLSCLFLASDPNITDFFLYSKKGNYNIKKNISSSSSTISFIKESKEITLILKKKTSPFIDLLLCDEMNSGIAAPLVIKDQVKGILFLNSTKSKFYDKNKFNYLKTLSEITSLMFHDIKLNNELELIINSKK